VMNKITPEHFITELYRRVYVFYCQKIMNHIEFSISLFNDEFTVEEMGRITGIEAKNKEIIITEQNLKDFTDILIDYKNNPIKDNKISTDDDLINIVKAKRKK